MVKKSPKSDGFLIIDAFIWHVVIDSQGDIATIKALNRVFWNCSLKTSIQWYVPQCACEEEVAAMRRDRLRSIATHFQPIARAQASLHGLILLERLRLNHAIQAVRKIKTWLDFASRKVNLAE